MPDDTEPIRRREQIEINAQAASRADLEARHGQVWDSDQLQQEFQVLGFMAPYCVVLRKSDGVRGSVKFQHTPRYYFSFEAE
jgi:hypothetical protein